MTPVIQHEIEIEVACLLTSGTTVDQGVPLFQVLGFWLLQGEWDRCVKEFEGSALGGVAMASVDRSYSLTTYAFRICSPSSPVAPASGNPGAPPWRRRRTSRSSVARSRPACEEDDRHRDDCGDRAANLGCAFEAQTRADGGEEARSETVANSGGIDDDDSFNGIDGDLTAVRRIDTDAFGAMGDDTGRHMRLDIGRAPAGLPFDQRRCIVAAEQIGRAVDELADQVAVGLTAQGGTDDLVGIGHSTRI